MNASVVIEGIAKLYARRCVLDCSFYAISLSSGECSGHSKSSVVQDVHGDLKNYFRRKDHEEDVENI